MGVNDKLQKLQKLEEILKTSEDFYIGENRIFDEKYINRGEHESEIKYKKRMNSTEFINFYSSIIDSLVGLITKKDPILIDMENINIENLDLRNNNLNFLLNEACLYSILDGLIFFSIQTNQVTKKVYFKMHRYKNLYSYFFENGVLSQIVFKETVEIPFEDFDLKEQERYTVFRRGGGDIWFDNGNGLMKQEEWKNSLDEIPVVGIKIGKELSQYEVIAPLYNMAILNKVLLNLSSQLSGLANLISSPIAAIFGEVEDKKPIELGMSRAIKFIDKTKEGIEYVEVKGKGLELLQNRYNNIIENLDKISFSLLINDNSKTVIDAQQNKNKNQAFVSKVAIELEDKFNTLIGFYAKISNINLKETAKIELEKKFEDGFLTDPLLQFYRDMQESQNLSQETLWDILNPTGILGKNFDNEIEKERLKIENLV